MLLVFDIGNTNITVGMYEGDKLKRTYRLTTKMRRTSDEYGFMITDFLNDANITSEDIEDVIIASVVPKVMHSFRNSIRKYLRKEPIIVGPGIKTGLNILLDNPAIAGGDLIVGAVAALAEYPAPMLIIDMGTATTITAIDAKGNYLGGCICPGVKIAAEALSSRTAQLPAISLEAPKKAIGRNTVDSMRSGLMMGSAALLDGMIERMEAELGQETTVIATGGIARFVIPMCKRKIYYDKDLLLKGLLRLYENNKKPGGR